MQKTKAYSTQKIILTYKLLILKIKMNAKMFMTNKETLCTIKMKFKIKIE